MLEVAVSWIKEADQSLGLPKFETDGAAGADLRANFTKEFRSSGLSLAPLQRELIPTGLCFEIPSGVEGQLRPRSGLALKHGLTLLNSPGTIDSDYRGELKIILFNHGNENFIINNNDRVAQMVLTPIVKMELEEINELPNSNRGDGGFGSTGK